MNDVVNITELVPTDVKHFVVAIDADGNEVRIPVEANGEFSQDIDEADEAVTVH